MKTEREMEKERLLALLDSAVFNALAHPDITGDEVYNVVDSGLVREALRRRGIAEREALLARYEQNLPHAA